MGGKFVFWTYETTVMMNGWDHDGQVCECEIHVLSGYYREGDLKDGDQCMCG
jgi:hypothetical protein